MNFWTRISSAVFSDVTVRRFTSAATDRVCGADRIRVDKLTLHATIEPNGCRIVSDEIPESSAPSALGHYYIDVPRRDVLHAGRQFADRGNAEAAAGRITCCRKGSLPLRRLRRYALYRSQQH